MKKFLQQLVNAIGTRMTHKQRRFVLDKLGLGAALRGIASDAFEEIELHDGRKITINRLYHAHMAEGGRVTYEDDVFEALRGFLTPGGVFWDVGANVGVFTFDAAKILGPEGRVMAFEPEPNNIACFERTKERLDAGTVTLNTIALGAEDGEMTFDRRGGAFSGRLDPSGTAGSHKVRVSSGDNLLAGGARPPTVIKIDVEGGEGAVVSGLVQILSTHAPILLIELHDFNPEGVNTALGVLAKANYGFFDLDGNALAADLNVDTAPRHVVARKRTG